MRKIGLSSAGRRIATLYTAADEASFADEQAHHSDIWAEWFKITLLGSLAGAGWSIWSTIYIANHSTGSAGDQLVGWLQTKVAALEADTAIKLLAVFATLSVAISVAVRTQPTGSGAAMEWARRRALVVAARAVAWAATLAAGMAAAWDPTGAGWSAPLAMLIWLIGAVVTLISADAIRFLQRMRTSEPGFDSWIRNRRIREISDRADRWSSVRPMWRRRQDGSSPPAAGTRSNRSRKALFAQTAASVLLIGVILSCGATVFWWAVVADQPVPALDIVDRLRRNLMFCVPAVAGMVLLTYQFVIQRRILRDLFMASFAAFFILAFVIACITLTILEGRLSGWGTERWVYVVAVEFAVVLVPVLYIWIGLRGRPEVSCSPWLTGQIRELAQLTVERTIAGLERRDLVAYQQRASIRGGSPSMRPGTSPLALRPRTAALRSRAGSRLVDPVNVRPAVRSTRHRSLGRSLSGQS